MREHAAPNHTARLAKAALAVLLALTLAIPATAYADPTAADKQAEAQAALASLNAMQENLDKATNGYHQAAAEQEEAQALMAEAQTRIEETNGEIAGLQDRLGDRARSMYRNGEISFIDLLFGAASFEEFATTWDILNQLNQNDADLVSQTKALRLEIEQQQSEYAKQEQIAADKASEAKRSLDEANATVSAMQATYDSLSSEAAVLLAAEQAARNAAAVASAQQQAAEQAQDNAAGNANGGSNNANSGSSDSNGSSSGNGSNFAGDNNPPSDGSIVGNARSKLGAPYVSGGKGPSSFDCSGFVAWCYGGAVPSYTGGLINLPEVSTPQPGDIAVIHNGSSQHCGIYIGGGMMIHAATYGVGVVEGPVQAGMIYVRP